MKTHKNGQKSMLKLTLTCMALLFAASVVQAAPTIYSPNSKPYGKTYGEWAAEHWKWLYSMPVDHHPLFDTADCSAGQSGPVWFLGGTFTVIEQSPGVVVGIANRTCTVPSDKALLFPIIDAECATAEGNGATRQELGSCAKSLVDHTASVTCELDGVAVKNLDSFRVRSPLFTWGPLPANNVFQDPANYPAGLTSPSISDGYFVMVSPLAPGNHTLHFAGSLVFTAANDGFDFSFSLDITYHLTVQ